MQVEIRYPTAKDNNGFPIIYKRVTENFRSPGPARKWAAKVITDKLKEYPHAAGHIKINAGTRSFTDANDINW